MLSNPFTPSEIASNPEDFFGRTEELRTLERSLLQGSVAIQGAIGIGKSSLMARVRLLMEGFDSSHISKTVIAVGDRDVKTVDEAARLLLESFIQVDERSQRIGFKFGSLIEIESSEICRYYVEGRHLAALKRIVEEEYLTLLLKDKEFLILAIDEADKCPVPIARLIRSVITHTQQQGVKKVRFIIAGVSPFFKAMVNEDEGIRRFFYKSINLQPMKFREAHYLLESKFMQLVKEASKYNIRISIDPDIIDRIVELSGGHPHLMQLLGSHIIEHENANPDNIIDSKDLLTSLEKICYEDRFEVYEALIHMLEIHGTLDTLKSLIDTAKEGFPTRIDRNEAKEYSDFETLQWLVENNILSTPNPNYYGLVDEFLRIRIIFDIAELQSEQLELKIIQPEYFSDEDNEDFYDDDEIEH